MCLDHRQSVLSPAIRRRIAGEIGTERGQLRHVAEWRSCIDRPHTLAHRGEARRRQPLGLSAAGTLDEQDGETPEVRRLAAALAADETHLLYSIVLHGRAELGLAPDEYSGLVMVLLRLLAFAPEQGAASAEAGPAAAAPTGGARSGTSAQEVEAAAAPAGAIRRPAEAGATPPLKPRSPAVAASSRPVSRVVARPPEPPPWVDEAIEEPIDGPRFVAQVVGTQAPVVEPPAAAAEWQTTPLGDRWAREVRALIEAGRISAMARELALQAQCVVIDGAHWRLRVEREALAAPAQRDRLQAALREARGEAVELDIEVGATQDTPARRDAAERARRQEAAERTIHDDPLVQALMRQYSTARIVPGSVKPH